MRRAAHPETEAYRPRREPPTMGLTALYADL
jgi:hypothetical protein